MWENFGNNIDNAFFYVVDLIFQILWYFRERSYDFAKIVLLIALLTTGLNYALTGTGLKENLIKILKATLFFFIVTAAYPKILAGVYSVVSELARNSVGKQVEDHFKARTEDVQQSITASIGREINSDGTLSPHYETFSITVSKLINPDNSALYKDLTKKIGPGNAYTVIAPANVIKIIFFLSGECFKYADFKEPGLHFPDFSRVLKGIACAALLIFTGIFAILEYVMCFLEFTLVSSVAVILLPFSIWEGSKFLSEGFIKSLVGFTLKMLFCTLAIYLMLYGFISLYYIITGPEAASFSGQTEEIIFIAFVCILFYIICKKAPEMGASLITGSPSLTGSGAIGAVAGAVGAAAAVGGFVQSKAASVKSAAGSVVGGASKVAGGLIEAGAAAKTAKELGSSGAGAFMSSLGKQASKSISTSLARSITGDKNSGTIGERNAKRWKAGEDSGLNYAIDHDK